MKKNLNRTFSKTFIFLFLSGFYAIVSAQGSHSNSFGCMSMNNMNTWFGVLELPFLSICMYYAFKTAVTLKGGAFGKGMTLMAWGFLVMGVGHLHMQIEHFMGVNLFNRLFGDTIGSAFWFVALIVTWLLSGMGFYSIYNVSKKP